MRSLFKNQEAALDFERKIGSKIIRSKLAPVVFSLCATENQVYLKGWAGKATKPTFNYHFSSLARAEEYAEDFVRKVKERADCKAAWLAERAAKRKALKASDHWAVGDVIYTSWGYDQTNVEYYQITRVLARSVAVRQVKSNSSDHGQACGGRIAPRRFEFIGPEFRCPLDEEGRFSAGPCYDKDKPSFRHLCHKWDGKAVYTSSTH